MLILNTNKGKTMETQSLIIKIKEKEEFLAECKAFLQKQYEHLKDLKDKVDA